MAKVPHSQCRGPGSIPGQGTRFHMPQLSGYRQQLKILHASTKTRQSQINKAKKNFLSPPEASSWPSVLSPSLRGRQTPVCFLPLSVCICFKGAPTGLVGRLGVVWERRGHQDCGPRTGRLEQPYFEVRVRELCELSLGP